MVLRVDSPCAEIASLNPPPRRVPLGVWCHLMAGPVALGGSASFAFGMIFALVFGSATDPVGTWRLARRSTQTRGWIDAVEATNWHEGGGEGEEGTPIYRYDYRFELPDGSPVRGASYTVGQQFHLAQAAPNRAADPVAVTVEYDPQDPRISRVQGTRTSPYTAWVLLILLLPAIAFLVALGGLRAGHRRGRLLRDGEWAAATVTACRVGCGEDAKDVPIAEYKRQAAEIRTRSLLPPLVLAAGAFVHVWTFLAMTIFAFGIVVCVVVLGMLFVFPTPPRERAVFALGISGFLTLWLLVGVFMVRSGRQACRAIRRREAGPVAMPAVNCTFEFRLPDGQIVRGKIPGRVTEAADEPSQPALYDPRRPSAAILLSGLGPSVRIGPFGDWETSGALESVVRFLGVLFLLIGPIAIALFLR
jgi:hypothetical protein